MTVKMYYTYRDLTGGATVTAAIWENDQTLVQLDRTLFAPKGGGQQSDRGSINGCSVLDVRYHGDDSILHVLPGDAVHGLNVGQSVSLIVDAERRGINSRLHTAGHLIAQIAERIVPGSTAAQGHHWPNESRVELIVGEGCDLGNVECRVTELANALVSEDRGVRCTDDQDGRRRVTIDGFEPIKCGGTHVASLKEIGEVVLRGAKWKKGRLRIGYDCE